MNDVALFLLTIAGIFLVGTIGELVFRRTGVPDVVWLILVGVILGPLSGVVPKEQVAPLAPYFAALTLIVVLFEGGSRLGIGELWSAAPRAFALATSTFLLAVVAMAVVSQLGAAVGLLPEGWSWMHGALLGTILGGSSSVIIMPAMAQAKVDPATSNLVSLESALTDVYCVVGATTLIGLMVAQTGEASPLVGLSKSFGLGVTIGGAGGALWLLVLKALRSSEHAYPITLCGLMVLYVAVDAVGGSAALAVLTFAVIVGNARSLVKSLRLGFDVDLRKDLRGFHSQVAFMVKSFFFTFIGLMLSPPWSQVGIGVLLGLVLFAVRAPGVWLSLWRSPIDAAKRRLVLVAMPRGMAAGVLATLPAYAGVAATETLPVSVFSTVATTIAIFAVGFWFIARTARMESAETGRPAPAAAPATPELPAAVPVREELAASTAIPPDPAP